MKKYNLVFVMVLSMLLVFEFAQTSLAATWKPITPDGYTIINWAKAPGIVTFYKAPNGGGSIDFLTRIYLPQNQIGFIMASSTPLDWGVSQTFAPGQNTLAQLASDELGVPSTTVASATSSANTAEFHNFSFARIAAEVSKSAARTAQFIWNGPFFNTGLATSDLSLALKSTVGNSTLITSGSRPDIDMVQNRRMLIVNNLTGTASISNFNEVDFVSPKNGDQALEGFAPTVVKSDSAGGVAARLFLGVTPNNKELVIYCSQGATVGEASAALEAAGVSVENQLEADGGGSATCGYNLPGQFFVEPSRTLPLLMGALTVLGRGTATTDKMNVRSGPSTKSTIVTKLAKNAPVRIFEEKNGWYRIGEGQWVLKSLIKKM